MEFSLLMSHQDLIKVRQISVAGRQAGRQEVRGQKIRGSGEHTLREGWDFLKNDLG